MKPLYKYLALSVISPLICILLFSKNAIPGGPPMVRVLIREESKHVSIIGQGRIKVATDKGEILGTFTPQEGKALEVSPLPSGINCNGEKYNSKLLVLTCANGTPIKIGDYSYRGEILIYLNNRWKLEIINRIGIEDYIKGLMKTEISPAWPLESLKAQAVVARTYSLYQIDRNKNGMYDLKASTESQVYTGITSEDPRTDKAVDLTKSVVLTANNSYLPALYHACCGGHTEDAKYVFNDHPALIGVHCSFCMDSPHFIWEKHASAIEIRNLFLRQYYRMGTIQSIAIMEKTPNARADTLIITHSLGRDIINGKQLRALMGYNIIRSTLFNVTNENDTFIFNGQGWGHGVGLCQWGAEAMAELGASYKEILAHYYPLASLGSAY